MSNDNKGLAFFGALSLVTLVFVLVTAGFPPPEQWPLGLQLLGGGAVGVCVMLLEARLSVLLEKKWASDPWPALAVLGCSLAVLLIKALQHFEVFPPIGLRLYEYGLELIRRWETWILLLAVLACRQLFSSRTARENPETLAEQPAEADALAPSPPGSDEKPSDSPGNASP